MRRGALNLAYRVFCHSIAKITCRIIRHFQEPAMAAFAARFAASCSSASSPLCESLFNGEPFAVDAFSSILPQRYHKMRPNDRLEPNRKSERAVRLSRCAREALVWRRTPAAKMKLPRSSVGLDVQALSRPVRYCLNYSAIRACRDRRCEATPART